LDTIKSSKPSDDGVTNENVQCQQYPVNSEEQNTTSELSDLAVMNHKAIAFHSTDDKVITNVYILSPSHTTPIVSEAQIVICECTGI